MKRDKLKTVEDYLKAFPKDQQELLQTIGKANQEVAPHTEEGISYQIPTFTQNGVLLSFAGFDKHIGLYPAPSGIESFKDQLESYKFAKGSVQFPLNGPIPIELIQEITKFRVRGNSKKKYN